MSKNDMVMVPRSELQRLQENMDPHRGAVAWGIVCDLLEKPAAHHGEPVALPERKDPTQHWVEPGGPYKAEGWNACLDEIAKLGPLYTRPAQDEPVAWLFESPEGLEPVSGCTRDPITAKRFKDAGWTVEQVYTHADPGEVTLQQILRAYEYAESHPHKYLRGTSNWCAAVAWHLNKNRGAQSGE